MFRIVYYVVPLVLALPVAFANEWKRRTDTGRGAAVEVQHAG